MLIEKEAYFFSLLIFLAINELQIIIPDPHIIVIESIFSSKKITPRIVAKISFEKSKGIRFVSDVKLIAFVQKKLPSVAVAAMIKSKKTTRKFDGVFQTYKDGKNVIGVIINTKLNINVKTFSVFDNFLTSRPAIAWVIDEIMARMLPI